MGTALNVSAWSTTQASNDGADSTIGTVANTSSPTVVDDWVKGVMASVKRYVLDTDGGLTSGGTANAQTLTTNRSISAGHQAQGYSLRFKAGPGLTNTGAATLNVDGLGAVAIKGQDGSDLSAGTIVAGGIYDVAHDGTNYKLIGASAPATRASLGLDTSDSPQFTGINLGHATDTTLTRVSAGLIAVEGTTIEPGASRSSFHAHRNGSSQTISAATATTVAFTTESFDVGSDFASNAWTPPAGTVLVTARVQVTGLSDWVYLRIKKGSAVIAEGLAFTEAVTGSASANVTVSAVAQASGSDAFTVTVQSGGDTSYTVSGDAEHTYFCGSML